jgi:gliding motility-associated lipoprotein GldD
LKTYLEDAHTLVSKHIPKASAINDSVILNRKKRIFGLAYDIEGTGAASPYQFFLTDSTSKFIRGALYFNVVPNNDSLEPVINFIKKDIKHLINTFSWKNIPESNYR